MNTIDSTLRFFKAYNYICLKLQRSWRHQLVYRFLRPNPNRKITQRIKHEYEPGKKIKHLSSPAGLVWEIDHRKLTRPLSQNPLHCVGKSHFSSSQQVSSTSTINSTQIWMPTILSPLLKGKHHSSQLNKHFCMISSIICIFKEHTTSIDHNQKYIIV